VTKWIRLDCAASLSLSVNLSVLQENSDLGYFWFPNLDVVVPMKPKQVLIFQGIEEHTGSPLRADPADTTPLPSGYPAEIRYNVICYPSSGIINGTNPLALDGSTRFLDERLPNLMEDALPHFGGVDNWLKWKKLIQVKRSIEAVRHTLQSSGDFIVHTERFFHSIQLGEELIDFAMPQGYLDFLEADDMKRRIQNLHSIIIKGRSKPFHKLSEQERKAVVARGSKFDSAGILKALKQSSVNRPSRPDGEAASIDEDVVSLGGQSSGTGSRSGAAGRQRVSADKVAEQIESIFDVESMSSRAQSIMSSLTLGSLNKGVQAAVQQLPMIEDLTGHSNRDVVSLYVAYGQVVNTLYEKKLEADHWSRVFRAQMFRLMAELVFVFTTNKLNLWSVAATDLPQDSLSFQLQRLIDVKTARWPAVGPERVLELSAADFLGRYYDPRIHLDVNLTMRDNLVVDNERENMMAFEALWGLVFHRSLMRFCNEYTTRQQRRFDSDDVRIGKEAIVSRKRIESRICLYLSLMTFLAKDENDDEVTNGLFMVEELFTFAFGFHNGELLQDADVNIILKTFKDAKYESQWKACLETAKEFGAKFDLDSMLSKRGTRTIKQITDVTAPPAKRKAAEPSSEAGPARQRRKAPRLDKQWRRDRSLEFLLTPDEEVLIQSAPPFRQQLIRYLAHVFEVGIRMLEVMARRTDPLEQVANWTPGIMEIQSTHTRQMVLKACNSPLNGDKFKPFRAKGPSLTAFTTVYKPGAVKDVKLFLEHLFIVRVCCFSRLALIKAVVATSSFDAAVQCLKDYEANTKANLGGTLAYGQYNISKHGVYATMEFFRAMEDTFLELFKDPQQKPTFKEVHHRIGALGIPNLPNDGLVPWLMAADIAHFGLCIPPAALDLAKKIGKVPIPMTGLVRWPGGAGSVLAFRCIHHETGVKVPYLTQLDLANDLTEALKTLNCMKKQKLETIVGQSELDLADIEHMLCKITREGTHNLRATV
jgi:hypothetical protein